MNPLARLVILCVHPLSGTPKKVARFKNERFQRYCAAKTSDRPRASITTAREWPASKISHLFSSMIFNSSRPPRTAPLLTSIAAVAAIFLPSLVQADDVNTPEDDRNDFAIANLGQNRRRSGGTH